VKDGSLELVVRILVEYGRKHQNEKDLVLKALGVSQLLVPVISLDLPLKMIVEYNRMEGTDPRFPFYYAHPIFGEEIRTFGLFLDKYDTDKSVICSLVWSTIDYGVVPLANINLKPYPLCWNSSAFNDFGCKAFGEKRCGRCGISRYCSKECQLQDWSVHKSTCEIWNKTLERCYVVTL